MVTETTVKYLVDIEPHQTDSAFYCRGEGYEVLAKVEHGERKFVVVSNGEMRINLTNGDVIRYTEDLLAMGIDTDEKFRDLVDSPEKIDAWVNNNWFEFWEVAETGTDCWEVYETVEEAVNAVLEILKEGRE